MAQQPNETGSAEPHSEDVLKQRLLGRIAVAAVVIIGLLGALAMFDALYAPRPAAPPTVATVVPPAQAPVTTPAVGAPATPPATGATPEAATPPAEANTTSPSANSAVAGVAEQTTAPSRAEPLPPLPAERLTRPASAQQAMAHPGGALSTAPAPSGSAATGTPAHELQREIARSPAAPKNAAPRPLAAAVSPLPRSPYAAAEGSRQFALQLGVFSNFANAEELRGKLEAAGIPATVEARVRAGPFATRAEADAARAKLRAMGIDESIMVSVKR